MRTRLVAMLLAAFMLLCGTALGSVALATHQASFHDITTAGGELVGAAVLLVLAVCFFTT